MEDKFFDWHSPIYETKGNLPHWNQRGKITFITFRLADSIPQNIIKDFIIEEKVWRTNHPFPVNSDIEQWTRRRHNRIEQYLDSGAGRCVLKESKCRHIIETALKFIDGDTLHHPFVCHYAKSHTSADWAYRGVEYTKHRGGNQEIYSQRNKHHVQAAWKTVAKRIFWPNNKKRETLYSGSWLYKIQSKKLQQRGIHILYCCEMVNGTTEYC